MVIDRTHLCSIDIRKATRERIINSKIHPRQSHDEVINKGLEMLEGLKDYADEEEEKPEVVV